MGAGSGAAGSGAPRDAAIAAARAGTTIPAAARMRRARESTAAVFHVLATRVRWPPEDRIRKMLSSAKTL